MEDHVVNDAENNRYVLMRGEQVLGEAEYELDDRVIRFVHTSVPDIGEKGLGSKLASGALDGVRADGTRSVVAICPFIRGYIDKHEEYQDLLDASVPPGGQQA